ncbi:hypothetical protein [Nocardioides sp.]|uniref:hypothetical protein n=1 Tax=Nocardioides sp. TaxID=35761 RepID=UPI0035173E80
MSSHVLIRTGRDRLGVESAHPPAHRSRHLPGGIPGAVACSYLVGIVAGRLIGTLWAHGPVAARGLPRLVAGARAVGHDVVHLHPPRPPIGDGDDRPAAPRAA